MLTREEFKKNPELVFDKAYGSLSGLAIGDSFGDASRKQENRENYAITTDFNSKASWSTDDTEFALLTAKTLIRCGGELTSEEVVKSWLEDVAIQDEFKRGGASEIEAANNLRRGFRPPLSGKYNAFHMSDGSAMRIGPIGIVCAGDPEKAAAMAKIESEVSHFRDGVWGAQAVAAAVSVAMVDGSMDEILDAAMNVIPEESWLHYSMNHAFELVDSVDGHIFDVWMQLHDDLRTSTWATTAEAIPSAFACLKAVNKDFRTGVVVAGNFGRDADTIGAVAGTILGAKYGAKAMPAAWIDKTRFPTGTCLTFTKGIDIRDYAEKLAEIIMK
ncbi:ADP-ribosylglycohydrolase family protein [[Clostridium] symbiosum]|uniref:ADP-ribosylglycohydrolase family protein n=1 Tax=Clostridium symbiosum TaxID=1512 RepID=UPI001D05F268|nr:ADP-ribosylglycohydrolase family protein [[Clostridium] symbiosum]MCB6609022.1 ADP-ribosylglycohydrolase family protein [[Clostridium] symbiosum]MCB6930447.1 ADP-ribosylglycohydrolase family protein [[Clostridium] symbiosum]